MTIAIIKMVEVDFLDEDSKVYKQTYAVFSYTLPCTDPKGKRTEGGGFPMFKIRGSYETVEECERRIKKLQGRCLFPYVRRGSR